MNDDLQITPGCTVRMHFSLALEDGTVMDATHDGEPMTFTLGDGTLIEGLELALIGLRAGDRQSLSIPPETGFGYPDPDNIHEMPLSEFSQELQPEAGLIMSFNTPDGDEVPATILAVEGDRVRVDFNHPLAGHEVVFSVEILDVRPPESDPEPAT